MVSTINTKSENALRRDRNANEKKKAEAIAAIGRDVVPAYRRKKRITRSEIRDAKKEAEQSQ